MSVFDAAILDAGQLVVEAQGQCARRRGRNLEYFVAVPDAGDRANDRRGAGAEDFFERAGAKRGDDFIDGNRAFLDRDIPVAQEGECAVAHHAGQNRPVAGSARARRS